jgi:hypothetical protein
MVVIWSKLLKEAEESVPVDAGLLMSCFLYKTPPGQALEGTSHADHQEPNFVLKPWDPNTYKEAAIDVPVVAPHSTKRHDVPARALSPGNSTCERIANFRRDEDIVQGSFSEV